MTRVALVALVTVVAVIGFVLAPLPARATSTNQPVSACIGHRPLEIPGGFGPYYTGGCTGHDEPELDPISSAAGSARNLTWTAVLPSDGASLVSSVGPTFWWGGTVLDSSSLLGQAFVELQFYPDAVVTKCGSDGSFQLQLSPNTYSACSPVWKVSPNGNTEKAAFNAMLTAGSSNQPLLMHGGDTIQLHWFTTPAADGFHVTVTDLTTHGSGTIVLNSRTDGPLMPAFSTQTVGNALGWGRVDDTPNSFVWEIGHTSAFASPSARFCVAGSTTCPSYNAASWAGILPLQILSVTFGDGSSARSWGVVSDLGGAAEVNRTCTSYGGPYCIYPWYSQSGTGSHTAFNYGVDYPSTTSDFGQGFQFATTPECAGPFGANTTYCDTVVV